MNKTKPTIGITIGDINGIGIETIIKTLSNDKMYTYANYVIYGSTKILSYHKKNTQAQKFQYGTLKNWDRLNPKQVNVVHCIDDTVEFKIGSETNEAGKYALQSINAALKDIKEKKIDALVTAPISKHTVGKHINGDFTGHTAYIAKFFNVSDYEMILTSERLNIGLVTEHIPVQKISEILNEKLIYTKIELLKNCLEETFAIHKPRIAVLSLNPHAGENGSIGDEEAKHIVPAINKAYRNGIYAFGPYASDGFFGSGNFKKFDGILAMYHDQGLIPFKTIAFEDGVNFTAGLPIIRTSPDHGPAYAIAGKNKADATSMRHAIYTALSAIKNKKQS